MEDETHLNARLKLIAAVAFCLLAACGGDTQVAGIEGSGLPVATGTTSVGTITGFGSIIVNGIEYATSGAQIRIDDQPAAESQLHVGDVVTVTGTVNADERTGTASEVTFSSDARGSIAQVNAASGSFIVLGQTIQVTGDTVFDEGLPSPDVSGLQPGTSVQVSGFADAAGGLIASRIEPAAVNASLQVKGALQALDTGARTFRINTLSIDYSQARVSGQLVSGGGVTVQGTAISAGGTLVATDVVAAPAVVGAANERGQFAGVITSFVSNSDFTVEGQRIATDPHTQFVLHGAVLGPDIEVSVRGTFNAAGILLATQVEAKQESSGFVRGVVDSVSSDGQTLNVIGVAVTTSDATVFEDRSKEHERTFKLSDLRVGDYVEVRGVPDGVVGTLRATQVQRQKPDQRSYVQGTALHLTAPSFTVLGVTVMTDDKTHFLGVGGDKGAAAFFSMAEHQLVTVRGTLVGHVLVAEQVQLRK